MTVVPDDVLSAGGSPTGGRSAMRRTTTHLSILLALLLVWEFVTATGIADELLFPRPSGIVVSAVRVYLIQATAWWHLWITVAEVLAGFLAGSLFGVGLAVFAALSETFRRYLKPYIIILEATPRIAMGPLLIVWLGFGFSSKLAVITLVCFFAPFINTLTGLLNTNEDRIELMRSLGATRSQTFRKIMLPNAAPYVMAGLRLAMASALGGALVAEFISANEGMGVILNRYAAQLNMSSAFAILLTLTVVGFALYRLMEVVETRIIFWHDDKQMEKVSRRRAAAWRNA